MIGFIAGVLAGIGIGVGTLATFHSGDLKVLLGIVAAGYAGTDFIENAFSSIIPAASAHAAVATKQTGVSSGATVLRVDKVGLVTTPTYGSLVNGGFFSSDPLDLRIHRSIRTNNPGALNVSQWQRERKGFAGVTIPDSSPDQNVTVIYRTPEHGVAAWFHLLNIIYNIGNSFTLRDLALRYAGAGASQSVIDSYVTGWLRWSRGSIEATTMLNVDRDEDMLKLGQGMFSHEAAMPTPLQDAQIIFGVSHERDGTLPA